MRLFDFWRLKVLKSSNMRLFRSLLPSWRMSLCLDSLPTCWDVYSLNSDSFFVVDCLSPLFWRGDKRSGSWDILFLPIVFDLILKAKFYPRASISFLLRWLLSDGVWKVWTTGNRLFFRMNISMSMLSRPALLLFLLFIILISGKGVLLLSSLRFSKALTDGMNLLQLIFKFSLSVYLKLGIWFSINSCCLYLVAINMFSMSEERVWYDLILPSTNFTLRSSMHWVMLVRISKTFFISVVWISSSLFWLGIIQLVYWGNYQTKGLNIFVESTMLKLVGMNKLWQKLLELIS